MNGRLKPLPASADIVSMGLPFLAGYLVGEHGRRSAIMASAADAHAAAAGAQKNDVYALQDRVDRLTLVVAAMWSLLEDQGMDQQALVDRIKQMDESDGVGDGKMTSLPSDCTGCGAKVPAGLPACQFCGTAVAGGGATDPFAQV